MASAIVQPAFPSAVSEARVPQDATKDFTFLLNHPVIPATKVAYQDQQQQSLLQGSQEAGDPQQSYVVASPYTDKEHVLNLNTLDNPNRLLAQALTSMNAIRNDYAIADYTNSFNWDAITSKLKSLADAEGYQWKQHSFYVVIFRSRRKLDINTSILHELDKRSHGEATASGGLLKYWFGVSDEAGYNLATCIWRDEEDAKRGGTGPWHKRARAAARDIYVHFTFTRLRLIIADDVAGWKFEDYIG